MNREKAQTAINKIVNDYRATAYKGGRDQYPASQKYLKRAEELGILDMIPERPYGRDGVPGNTEIQIILAAAEDDGKRDAVMNRYGEGEDVSGKPSVLYLALNEDDASDDTNGNDEQSIFEDGDRVYILKHTQTIDTFAGATHSTPQVIDVGGYYAKVYGVEADYDGFIYETNMGHYLSQYVVKDVPADA